jgi:hypothetical protein
MAQWGRNDQAVTANSTTEVESSSGAPIGTYALVKGSGLATSMVANAHYGNTSPGSRASVDSAMFANVTPGVFVNNMSTGVFGVSASEMANNTLYSSQEHPAHAGWVYRKAGTGPVIGVTANVTSMSAYDNTDLLVVKSTQAGGNATISFTTNSTGGNLNFTIVSAGAGFLVTSIPTSNLLITNATGGTATGNSTVSRIVVTAGGRAGRVHTETLVAMGSLGSNTTSSTGVYGADSTRADAAANADEALYPGR